MEDKSFEEIRRDIDAQILQVREPLFTSKAAPDPDWYLNSCLNVGFDDWDIYAIGYKRAGDVLVQYVIDCNQDQDFLVYPIVFLYRQYLELRLKELIFVGGNLLDQDAKIPKTHDLVRLWAQARPNIESIWPDSETISHLNATEERLKELCDVDLILCQLSITRALHQLQDGSLIIRQPKTAKGRRLISLSPSTTAVLVEHREQQEKLRKNIGSTLTEDDLVFCHEDGTPLLPNTVSHAWTKLANRVGLKGIRLHDARHTHASLMLKQGVHPKIVQERLGHASIQITLDTYSHVAPGLQQAAANRFDEIVITKKNEFEKDVKEIAG